MLLSLLSLLLLLLLLLFVVVVVEVVEVVVEVVVVVVVVLILDTWLPLRSLPVRGAAREAASNAPVLFVSFYVSSCIIYFVLKLGVFSTLGGNKNT